MKELLASLRLLPEFQEIMRELAKDRPIVPPYTMSETIEADEAMIRVIKDLSAQQKGWDLLWMKLTGRKANGRD